jgi:hypothetical protein
LEWQNTRQIIYGRFENKNKTRKRGHEFKNNAAKLNLYFPI